MSGGAKKGSELDASDHLCRGTHWEAEAQGGADTCPRLQTWPEAGVNAKQACAHPNAISCH